MNRRNFLNFLPFMPLALVRVPEPKSTKTIIEGDLVVKGHLTVQDPTDENRRAFWAGFINKR